MSDGTEPSAPAEEIIKPLSHGRILKLMALIGLGGGVLGAAFISAAFGAGVIAGTVLAFVNYYWLQHSLKNLFAAATETGERPRLLGLKYLGRYAVLAAVVAALYISDLVSITGLILGIGSFGIAVIFEGFLRIFSGPPKKGEN
jgi:hypothetical protein